MSERREFEPYELGILHDLVEEPQQRVSSNSHQRYYTEDVSENNWNATHHLIDVDQRHGANYCKLTIHQFNNSNPENNCTVTLSANEVEELLAIALTMRLAKAKEEVEKGQRARVPAPSGDDFDPFIDSDDLP